jgi:hypothetical protein
MRDIRTEVQGKQVVITMKKEEALPQPTPSPVSNSFSPTQAPVPLPESAPSPVSNSFLPTQTQIPIPTTKQPDLLLPSSAPPPVPNPINSTPPPTPPTLPTSETPQTPSPGTPKSRPSASSSVLNLIVTQSGTPKIIPPTIISSAGGSVTGYVVAPGTTLIPGGPEVTLQGNIGGAIASGIGYTNSPVFTGGGRLVHNSLLISVGGLVCSVLAEFVGVWLF